jgi:predicted nucleotidyltransferase
MQNVSFPRIYTALYAMSHASPPLRRQAKVVEAKVLVCYMDFMKRDEAISRLQQREADLRRLGVEHLYMFGSTAHGEAKDDSDVDLFFDYEKGKLGLFELMDVKEYAASAARPTS